MKGKLFIFLSLICCVQLLWAQDQPMVFQPALPHQHWNKYIVLYPEGLYFTIQSHIGHIVRWGEWMQKGDTICFRRFPQAYSDKDIEFKLGYEARLQGQTFVTSNLELLAVVRGNFTASRDTHFGGKGQREEFLYQVDTIDVVWSAVGEQVKRISLYDAENSRYNNVVKIKMKEDVRFVHDAPDHSFRIVNGERLIDTKSGVAYVRKDDISASKFLSRDICQDVASTMGKYREHRAVISYNLPVAKEVYNPDSVRLMRKLEHNRQTLKYAELERAVLTMFDEVAQLPNERVLSSEDEYILFVNYMCQATEINDDIWQRAYVQFEKYPEKLYCLTEYIELLPDKERESARKRLCTSLAYMHTIKMAGFNRGSFRSCFWEMMRKSQYSQYIYWF